MPEIYPKKDKKIIKIKRFIAVLLAAIMLGNQLGTWDLSIFAVPEAHAQEGPNPTHTELGIMAILVEKNLLDDKTRYETNGDSATLTEHIFAYAENAQKRIPHTRALVIGVDPEETTHKISTVLEKLYYEGMDNDLLDDSRFNDDSISEDDNRLSGVVLVGNVPVPVVYDKDGTAGPSLYPYTDFYRKQYIYNYETDHFEFNSDALKPTPEIWHGVIVPPTKQEQEGRQQMADFFYKNNQYSNNLGDYSTFNKRLLYYNFPAVEKKLNTMDYNNYKRSIKYAEEIGFQRFNRHLLREMVLEIAAETDPDTPPEERTPLMDDGTIANMSDSAVKLIIRKFTNTVNNPKDVPKFIEALRSYIGRLNPIIARTGRWSEKEYDSLASLINHRDAYMQQTLIGKSVELENRINAAIQAVQENFNLIESIEIKVRECDDPNCDHVYEENTFNLQSFISGQPVSLDIGGQQMKFIFFAEQCGLERGQKRPPGVPVQENNSVLVEANRLNNPNSAIIPDPDDDDPPPLREDPDYINYAGCVANNSITYHDYGNDIHLDPDYCKPDEAYSPVSDIAGAKEADFEVYNPAILPPDKSFDEGTYRCSAENMSFLPFPRPSGGINEFFDDNTGYSYGLSAVPLRQVVNSVYQQMVNDGEIFDKIPDPNDAEAFLYYLSPHRRLNKIAGVILASDYAGTRSYAEGGNTIEFTLTASTEPINSVIRHTEPTTQTLDGIRELITPNTPADGIRFVDFYREGDRHTFRYPNLFRIEGNNLEDVATNLLQEIEAWDDELNVLLGSEQNIVSQFFFENFNPAAASLEDVKLLEPILWRNMGIDQKHQMILEKYVNRDSFLPVPNAYKPAPQTKPEGYEVLHIFADGDEKSFEFALNASRLTEAELSDPEFDAARQALEDFGEDDGEDGDGTVPESPYSCGPKEGVEIWEWFPILLNCWFPEEIGKLDTMISLENSCTGADIPAPEETPIEEDPLDDTDITPAKLEVSIARKTLMRGEDTPVKVKILNNEDKTIIGYLEDPLAFSVSDSNLAHFSQSELEVFTGEGRLSLIAENQTGNTELSINLGGLSSTDTIRVVEGINIHLSAEQDVDTGRPSYKIKAHLVDLEGNPITDVNTEIRISTLRPTDGVFIKKLIKIQEGQGETVFFPKPTSLEIDISASHPVYTSDVLHITQEPGPPAKILIDAPKELLVGKNTEIPVKVTDVNGIITPQFNETIHIKVTDKTRKYGALVSEEVQIGSIEGGKGTINLKVGTETAKLNLIASHDALAPGIAEIPIVAKVTQNEWSQTFPQNLFASMAGFPAGNFLEEDYFAGAHLFNGKTQAVFAFMSTGEIPPTVLINPNYQIQTYGLRQMVRVEPFGNAINLEVFDQGTLESLLSTSIPLDFKTLAMWDEEAELKEGTLYFEPVNESHKVEASDNAIEIFDAQGSRVLTIRKNALNIYQDYELFYEKESDFNSMELVLANGFGEAGRLRLNFSPSHLNPDDFEIQPDLALRKSFYGKSTADPNGLILFDPSEDADEKEKPGENFGFEGDNKHILRFGGGSPAGEAVMFNLPHNAVLLGDPTIRLENQSASSLNYDDTIGRQIFQDPEGGNIVALTNFNFNNDNIEDIAVVMKDGRIRLFEGGATEPLYRDRGDIAFNSDGAISIIAFDFKNDGYEDLLVATREGRLAILHNDREVITRTDQKIKVGKQLYQIMKADMDADTYPDLITLDSRGDIRIFYNQTPLFPERPVPAKDQIQENGVLIGNYGFSLQLGANLKRDLQIRFPGMRLPDGTYAQPPPPEPPPPPSDNEYGFPDIEIPETPSMDEIADFADKDTSGDVSESEAWDLMREQEEAAELARTTGDTSDIPKLPWKEGEDTESYFAPIKDFESYNAAFNNGLYLTVNKTVENIDRPGGKELDLNETLKYTIVLQANQNVNDFILVDTVPDLLKLDEKSVMCEVTGCEEMESTAKGIYLFLSRLNLRANQPVTITYEADIKHTPKSAIMLKRITDPTGFQPPIDASYIDPYMDILVSPPYNNTGQLMAHYTIAPREYALTTTVKEQTPEMEDVFADMEACQQALANLQNMTIDEDTEIPENFISDMLEPCGVGDAAETILGSQSDALSPEECGENPDACSSSILGDIGDFISNLSCMGGGCFPMPYNMTFLAPQSIPMALPVLALPTTLPTAVGPIPFASLFLAPTLLGATDIPGTFNSMLRLYVMPTLTGGIGIGLCWGPYMGNTTVPPPLVPIPYPPPIGNCMTIALPVTEIPGLGDACKLIEDGITAAMEAANSVVSDINSGIAAVNSGGVPAEIQQGSSEEGAGGIEISLAIDLGNSQKFEPPSKGFTNKHISGFDSIGGVIASWLDRQLLEIFNKLFTLPTIRVILPDFESIFVRDWDELNKLVEAWSNNVSREGADKAAEEERKRQEKIADEAKQKAGEAKGMGAQFLEDYESFERTVRSYNTNLIDQVYAIAEAMPFIKITEHNIDFKVPWLSFAQLNDLIRDFEQSKNYYERQWQKYVDLIEEYKCPPGDDPCLVKKIANIFVVDLETFIQSIQKNIEALQSYMKLPRDFILLKRQLADYIRQVACYLDTYSTMMGGWFATIQNQMIGYAEAYYTIIEIADQWKKLVDVFVDFEDSCDICTNERFANFGWFTLLGLVIPDIPIIKFPKWPDIVLDFSNMNAQINIELPAIHFVLEPITLPRIPRIPFPDIPNLMDLRLFAQIPPLPVLPSLPKLPELPPLPAIPVVDLPTLPPPPKLPDTKEFKFIIDLVEQILQIWCMIKKSFAPIPEAYLKDHVTLLTNRPSYMIPLDFLKPKIGDIAAFELGYNELRIETTVYLGVRLKMVLEEIQEAADRWNKIDTNIGKWLDEKIQERVREMTAYLDDISQKIEEMADLQDMEDWLQGKIDEYVQEKFLDEYLRKNFEAIDEIFRDAENTMQKGSDWLTDTMGEPARALNQAFMNALSKLDSDKWAEDVREFFAKHITDPYQTFTDFMDSHLSGEVIQELIDEWSDALEDYCAQGGLCVDEEQAYSPPSDKAVASIPQNLKNNLFAKFDQLTKKINNMNNSTVDYNVLKEELGVPDYHLPAQPTAVNRIQAMSTQLLAYSEQLNEEADEAENTTDLFALIQSQADAPLPFELASMKEVLPERVIFESKTNLPKQSARMPKPPALPEAGPEDDSPSGPCTGSCLVDPETGTTFQFISHFDNPATTQTGFINSGSVGHSHVVYSDEGSLYLKRDLSVPQSITVNIPPHVPNIIFSLDRFISIGRDVMPLKESVNMLAADLTENGAASFSWMESTNPDVYGYGIELERSVFGYDADRQANNLSDVKIVLLPPNEDGTVPRVTVGKQVIEYGTLITSFEDPEEARAHFGVEPRTIMTGGDKVIFRTINDIGISLNTNRAVYFDQYTESSYRMIMDNGFYHIKMTWFDELGRVANYNHNELLAPQIYVKNAPPVDILFDREFLVPVYKEKIIDASEIFTDLSGVYKYYWDFNQDGLPESVGQELIIPAQNEPKEFFINLAASINLEDESFERFEKQLKVIVYPPEISLEENKLKENNLVEGIMEPLEESHDLTDIPFSIFRKRWGKWKNLGLLKKEANQPSTPPLSNKNNYQDNYYAINSAGGYSISNFTTMPAPIIIRDEAQNDIARVHPETGQIEIIDLDYELKAVPASKTLPTRVVVLKKGFDTVVSNIYYVSEENTDVTIRSLPLSQENISYIGVTAGDANPNDTIIARNIPGHAESYPGGAAIFNDTTQTNVALVNTDGAIRMMQRGYSLRLKNEGALDERVIFEITDDRNSQSIFDVFISADFDNLEIRQEEVWNEIKATIGYLKKAIKPLFASLVAQNKPSDPKSSAKSPFPDIDSAHPYFQQILDLYNRRIVSGYGDGTFRPDAKLSRAEFVKIALGATNCFDCSSPTDVQREKYTPTRPFPDVSLPAWYYFCVAIAKELGMVTGYGDGFFRPARNISRAEAAAILIRQSVIELKEAPEEYFLDVPDHAWYIDYVYTAVEIGLVRNNNGFVFPEEEITRGEFAFMASSVLDLQDCRLVDSDGDGMPDWWEMENNLDPLFSGDAGLDNDFDNFTNLQEYKNGTDPNVVDVEKCPCIDNPNQNDTDKDGIIDPCDEDLDDDGVTNILCMFDESGLVDPIKAAESEDNCIFTANPPQTDTDADGVGDACVPIDQCPEIPEDLDGYHDMDGCPEVDDETEDNPPGVYVNKGPSPPCFFLDYEADLVEGDVIMTAITDVQTHDVIYSKSNEVIY